MPNIGILHNSNRTVLINIITQFTMRDTLFSFVNRIFYKLSLRMKLFECTWLRIQIQNCTYQLFLIYIERSRGRTYGSRMLGFCGYVLKGDETVFKGRPGDGCSKQPFYCYQCLESTVTK